VGAWFQTRVPTSCIPLLVARHQPWLDRASLPTHYPPLTAVPLPHWCSLLAPPPRAWRVAASLRLPQRTVISRTPSELAPSRPPTTCRRPTRPLQVLPVFPSSPRGTPLARRHATHKTNLLDRCLCRVARRPRVPISARSCSARLLARRRRRGRQSRLTWRQRLCGPRRGPEATFRLYPSLPAWRTASRSWWHPRSLSAPGPPASHTLLSSPTAAHRRSPHRSSLCLDWVGRLMPPLESWLVPWRPPSECRQARASVSRIAASMSGCSPRQSAWCKSLTLGRSRLLFKGHLPSRPVLRLALTSPSSLSRLSVSNARTGNQHSARRSSNAKPAIIWRP